MEDGTSMEHGTAAALPPERTPLQEQLQVGQGRPTALEAFSRARRTFLAGQRVDMGALARDLGVNRATLYRWVGSREQLLVEILWSLARRTFDRLLADPALPPPGRSRVAAVLAAFVHAVMANRGMQVFVEDEGDLALRLLTTRATDYQARLLDLVRGLLAEDIGAGRVRTAIPLEDLAYVVVRVLESYVYLTLITGERPDPERAGRVLHGLLPPT
jgi:AcrR family transcriptional regulator